MGRENLRVCTDGGPAGRWWPAASRRLRVPPPLVCLFVVACLWGCSNGESNPGQTRNTSGRNGVPVTVETAVSKTVPVQIRAVGTVQAYATVTLKSQLDAEVAQIHFTEGQAVKKGDLLFTLDQRPWEAALRQAEANLGRDTAQLQQAEAAVAQTMAAEKQAGANLRSRCSVAWKLCSPMPWPNSTSALYMPAILIPMRKNAVRTKGPRPEKMRDASTRTRVPGITQWD